MNTLTKKEEDKYFTQRLQRVHVTVGISFSILMYIAIFFGIFGIFNLYIKTWEKPSRHIMSIDITKVDYSAMIDPVLADPTFPKVNGVKIFLPEYKKDPALRISADFIKGRVFNPNTNKEIKDEMFQSQLSYFLNTMHYGKPFNYFGRYLFGLVAVAGMFLIIGGVILVLKVKYNKGKNAQSKFSKWHRKILTWIFPPFILITLTGALMNIGTIVSVPMTYIASKGEAKMYSKLSKPILYPKYKRIKKLNDNVTMLAMNDLVKKAQKINPDLQFQKIEISNWNDSSALFKISGYNPYMPFLNGISNKPSITLSGFDGRLIEQKKVLDKHWSGLFYDSVYFLHFLYGVDIFTRFFLATVMLISACALGFGVLLWLEKKARKFPKDIPVYQGMGKLSLATMIGVIPATGLMFFLQWILPFDMIDRFLWHKGIFAVFWCGTLAYSFYKLNSYQTAKEFLILGGFFYILTPFIHFYSSGFSPQKLWNENLTSILNVDIGLFLFGLILLIVGFVLPKEREEVQKFWTKIL
jgi:uncharacterized iron-regulated membrane protein